MEHCYASYQLVEGNNDASVGGTCLLLRLGQHLYVITARHCIDTTYADPMKRTGIPSRLKVNGYRKVRGGRVEPVEGLELHLSKWFFDEEENDLAVAKVKSFDQKDPVYVWHEVLMSGGIAFEPPVGSSVSFAGYPASVHPADERTAVLVVREGIVSTHPSVDVQVPKAIGRSYGLIDAFRKMAFPGRLSGTQLMYQSTCQRYSECLACNLIRLAGVFVLRCP